MTAAALPLDPYLFLRRTLFADAASCAAMGLALVLLGEPLAPYLGIQASLLQIAGASLLPVAAFMAWVATRELPAFGAWLVIAGNAAWIAGSIAVLVLASPSALGYAFVIGQALVVAILAELEYAGIRRAAA